MASFLTRMLEGSNLSQFGKFANDGDLKHLGTIGQNLTLIGAFERSATEQAIQDALTERDHRTAQAVRQAQNDAEQREFDAEQRQDARAEAIRLTADSRSTIHKATPARDSNDGVDSFITGI